ncbi:ATP-binding protein [Streptomyces sp. NPDC020996]|uniref:ATP-binding protein n=1 Tax=Streptomyces sp. NPDC020996 TaxID=3154791 RepID=UPI0033F90273
MTNKGGALTSRLRSRLVVSRDRAFVGRETETALFRAMLAGEPDVAPVLFLHGPGGIGKSTLLRRFAREAAEAGRAVVEVDARTTDPTPEGFERAAADVLHLPGAVLLIDTFEMCQGLEGWLWERFLPELPLGAVAVLAGRTRPDSRWTSDAGWSDHLTVLPLKALAADDSVKFLAGQGVPPRLHGDVLAFTGGHPLALSLAAAVAREDAEDAEEAQDGEDAEDGAARRPRTGSGAGWAPDQDVIATLLARLADHPPSPLHRQALEVCAHAYVTSEELLRAMLGEEAPELFAWLRAQPYIETAATGIFPHDVVREALEADLRWRDPEGFVGMHLRMHDHLLDRLRKGPAHQLMSSVAALMYMYRTDGHMPEVHEWHAPGRVQELPFAPGDEAAVLELTERAEGAESAEIARRWLRLHPSAFRVHRSTRTRRPVAFTATLWLGPDEEDATSVFDPVIAAAWRRARRLGPVRRGERMAVTRFMVHPPLYHRPSASMTLMHWRAMGEVWRDAGGLTHHFAVYRDDGYWDSHMSHYGMAKDEEPVHVGDHAYRLYGRDYRTGLEEYLTSSTDAMLAAAAGATGVEETRPSAGAAGPAPVAELSREEFGAAVRDALRALRSPKELQCSPLTRSRIVAAADGDLAGVLLGAAEVLPAERGGERRHRAFTATYDGRPVPQQAVAARLGLPFSTYRRHLKEAVERITDHLWECELNGVPVRGAGK